MERTLVHRYALPPDQIEALSLKRVAAQIGPTDHWTAGERAVGLRMVYAAGDAALAPLICFHPRAVSDGTLALSRGASIIVDVRMVEVALDHARARALGCDIVCRIDDPGVAIDAKRMGLPRSVLAMRTLAPRLAGAIVVIGNAPTALLSLLDLVDQGAARPVLVVGVPVGFVAATEAKAELAKRAVPFITVEGTRGGSALAAAAVNALLRLADSDVPL